MIENMTIVYFFKLSNVSFFYYTCIYAYVQVPQKNYRYKKCC